MAAPFHFEHSVSFSPETASEILRSIPTLPGVFALFGPREEDQPYLTRAADLRPPHHPHPRAARLANRSASTSATALPASTTPSPAPSLNPPSPSTTRPPRSSASKKLDVASNSARPSSSASPPRTPTRASTPPNRLSKRALANYYGPFPSRAAADRYCDAVLDLFKLRRCVEDLAPYPEHPGCVYGEMNKCLAPCNQACTPEGAVAYAHEADPVKRFFDTARGESMIVDISLAREEASNALHYELAAALHAQWHKSQSRAQSLADELVQRPSPTSAPSSSRKPHLSQRNLSSPERRCDVILSRSQEPPRILAEAPPTVRSQLRRTRSRRLPPPLRLPPRPPPAPLHPWRPRRQGSKPLSRQFPLRPSR